MSNNWNLITPHTEGEFARQAHADIPAGSFERELGRDGFFGAATHMYHRNPPTAWEAISGALRPRAFSVANINVRVASPWEAQDVVHNASVRVRFWRTDGAMPHLVRNGDGDDLLFVHQGGGDLFCDYGHIPVREGDYVLLPRGTMWRLEAKDGTDILMVESTAGQFSLPDRAGVGRHAPFDPGVLARPEMNDLFRSQQGPGKWEVHVKRGNRVGCVTYPFNPLDAMGWKGDLYPVRLNMHDIRPLMSHRMHLPPSAYTTFLGNRFVICSFVPRPMESDPNVMKLPFFHNNEDYDEVMFCHRGSLGARGSSFRPGSFTFHPAGLTHGPHPEALPNMFKHPTGQFEGYNVMIDAEDALEVATLPAGCEVEGYDMSWRNSIALAPDANPNGGRRS